MPSESATKPGVHSFFDGECVKLSWVLYLGNIILSVHGEMIYFGWAKFVSTYITLNAREFSYRMVFNDGNIKSGGNRPCFI